MKSNALQRYHESKRVNPDAIPLVKCGDFYETFGEDAEKASKTLGLALSVMSKWSQAPMPMTGFPYYNLDDYSKKLAASGLSVAVIEPSREAGKQ